MAYWTHSLPFLVPRNESGGRNWGQPTSMESGDLPKTQHFTCLQSMVYPCSLSSTCPPSFTPLVCVSRVVQVLVPDLFNLPELPGSLQSASLTGEFYHTSLAICLATWPQLSRNCLPEFKKKCELTDLLRSTVGRSFELSKVCHKRTHEGWAVKACWVIRELIRNSILISLGLWSFWDFQGWPWSDGCSSGDRCCGDGLAEAPGLWATKRPRDYIM